MKRGFARVVEAVRREAELSLALLYLWWVSSGARPPGKQYPFSPDPSAPRCTTCGTTAHPLQAGECPLCEEWNRKARQGTQPAVFVEPEWFAYGYADPADPDCVEMKPLGQASTLKEASKLLPLVAGAPHGQVQRGPDGEVVSFP